VIQKTLLSCWFGRGKKSDLFLKCEETKRKMLPDWERFEVNEDTIDPEVLATPYMQAVQARGEFVKMTELGRLWALWKIGGVYCDEDIEILKPFDPLLNDSFFIGYEDDQFLNGAVMGSVAGDDIASRLYHEFPDETLGELKATAYGPAFLTEQLRMVDCTKYAPEYFYPIHYDGTGKITENSFTNHLWASSWREYATSTEGTMIWR
jgi:mannosyltransferase OCH1-like enzyme